MIYSRNSPLIKTGAHYSGDQLWAAMEPMTPDSQKANAKRLLAQIAQLAVTLHLDEVAASSIVWIETGAAGTGLPFRSEWWVNGYNAGNLGVTGDKAQNAASQQWQTPTDGATGLMAHLTAYAYGSHWRDAWNVDDLGDPRVWDTRFDLALAATDGKPVMTLDGLNNRWAVDIDNDYGGKLAERANKLVAAINDPPVTTPSTGPEPVEPGEQENQMATVFGRVPKPPAINKHIPSSQNTAWDNLGPRAKVPNAFVLHRMEGSLEGTNTYFRGFRNAQQTGVGGLTNIGIGVAAMDGQALAGKVYEWNTPELDTEDRAGWANGKVSGAYGDGKKYVDMFGISAVNRDTESCEISGQLNTPLDEASRTAIAARLAWRADQYGAELAKKGEQFDYSTFPYIPSQDRNFTIWHQEFTIGTGKTCPGPVVMAETDDLIARAKVILEKYQTGSVTPQPEPEPVYADAAPVEKGSRDLNGYIFLAPGGKTVQVDTYPVKYADTDQPPTGPKLVKGTKISQDQISHYVVGTDGKQWVVLTGVPGVKDGSRFPATALIADTA